MLAPRKTLWSTPDAVIERVIERTLNHVPCRRRPPYDDDPSGNNDNDEDESSCWFRLTPKDVVCDVGCGDGRVLLRWAAHVSAVRSDGYAPNHLEEPQWTCHDSAAPGARETTRVRKFPGFVGIDVDPDRIRAAQDDVRRLRREGRIHPDVSVKFWCANALDCSARLQQERVTVYFMYLIPRGLRIVKPLLLADKRPSAAPYAPSVVRVITYMSPLDGEVPTRVEKVAVPHQPGASWPLYYYEFKRPSLKC